MPSREGRLSKAQVLQPGTEELTLGEGVSYIVFLPGCGERQELPQRRGRKSPQQEMYTQCRARHLRAALSGVDKLWWKMGAGDR